LTDPMLSSEEACGIFQGIEIVSLVLFIFIFHLF
jgi:hypothetical protein